MGRSVWKCAAALLLSAAIMISGCATGKWERMRSEQATAFREQINARMEAMLADGAALDLETCVDTALRNNLTIKTAEIQQRIARLERKAAFANFLPQVQLDMKYVTWDRQPQSRMMGLLSVPMHDQDMLNAELGVQMPIFVPATWYLYAMRRRGAEIGALVTEHTRRQIVLMATALYFQCVALDAAIPALESQVAAAETLEREVWLFFDEGLVTAWQAEQASALVLSRRTALEKTRRARRQAGADLLAAMGLSPVAETVLVADTPLEAPDDALEDLVFEALIRNPRLIIADRNVTIQKNRVRLAIAEFLPKLVGILNQSHTSNSFTRYPDATMLGVAGVMTVFNGLENVREYQIARQAREAAYVQREEACFAVMSGVVRAWLNLQDARDELALARKAYEVESARRVEVEAQWREGLVNASDRLDAAARCDIAQMRVTQAAFSEQVRIATLLELLGRPITGMEHEETASESSEASAPAQSE